MRHWILPALYLGAATAASAQTGSLIEQLRQRGVEHEVLVFPDEVHGFLLHTTWLRAYAATAEFFRRKLGG